MSGAGTFLAAGEAQERERAHGVPAEARAEDRGLQRGLLEHLLEALGSQQVAHGLEREAVLRAEREEHAVVGRGGLELEVERATEALAHEQAERAVDARTERGVHDELHAARLVEEALRDDAARRRQRAERQSSPRRRTRARAARPRARARTPRRATRRRPSRGSPRGARRARSRARACATGPRRARRARSAPGRARRSPTPCRTRRAGCARSCCRGGTRRRRRPRWPSPRRRCRPWSRRAAGARRSSRCRGWRRRSSAQRAQRRAGLEPLIRRRRDARKARPYVGADVAMPSEEHQCTTASYCERDRDSAYGAARRNRSKARPRFHRADCASRSRRRFLLRERTSSGASSQRHAIERARRCAARTMAAHSRS